MSRKIKSAGFYEPVDSEATLFKKVKCCNGNPIRIDLHVFG